MLSSILSYVQFTSGAFLIFASVNHKKSKKLRYIRGEGTLLVWSTFDRPFRKYVRGRGLGCYWLSPEGEGVGVWINFQSLGILGVGEPCQFYLHLISRYGNICKFLLPPPPAAESAYTTYSNCHFVRFQECSLQFWLGCMSLLPTS